MIWITPSGKDTASGTLEKCRWDAAHQFQASRSGLKAQEHCGPIPGIIRHGGQDNNVRRLGLVYDDPFVLNQRLSKLVPVESSDWAMICCMFRELEGRVKLEQLANGVAPNNRTPAHASKVELARALRELRQLCATLAQPMVRRIVQLFSTNQYVRRTRVLMPRLLSGQVSLTNTEDYARA